MIPLIGSRRHYTTVGAASPEAIVEGTVVTTSTANNPTYDLPADIVAGELLLLLTSRRVQHLTSVTGFTELYIQDVGSSSVSVRHQGFYRIADGTEGATVSTVSDGINSRESVCIAHRISGQASGLEAATSSGTSDTPNPPSLSPSWGDAPTLWIAVAGTVESNTFVSYPDGYLDGVGGNTGGTFAILEHRAYLHLSTGTEDPGVFTYTTSRNWAAATIGVQSG